MHVHLLSTNSAERKICQLPRHKYHFTRTCCKVFSRTLLSQWPDAILQNWGNTTGWQNKELFLFSEYISKNYLYQQNYEVSYQFFLQRHMYSWTHGHYFWVAIRKLVKRNYQIISVISLKKKKKRKQTGHSISSTTALRNKRCFTFHEA